MKKIVLLFAIFISCNNINHLKREDDLVTLSVPIGERIITKYNFPVHFVSPILLLFQLDSSTSLSSPAGASHILASKYSATLARA